MKALQETGPFEGYDSEIHPLGSYGVLIGTFSTTVLGFLGWMGASGRRLPERFSGSDLALFGAATHVVTRVVAADKVTAVVRAPFTRFKGNASAGEVSEQARGTGFRHVMGELLDCPFCLSPWVAASFLISATVRPRQTRFVASIFALSGASFFLHRAYELLGEGLHRTRAQARLLHKEQEKQSDAGVQFPGRGPQVVEPGRAPIPSPS
ncbi:hypothetical protein COCOR_00428 [Corallococcus coralloides DSM 2259]|uniref:DUF1360 domain-containing protein n=1 Tax=Corallococcus coralloides (strain ATCC 25202 / DSM 2259 / NBRC 100086 / M2) TaxID=1144275 RepID=H8MZX9_CORCM|nr:DUF1360 domain-containing protein [Corallococcus coralloides]AFE03482.1 hypothetical protein COCOR_00428 [Corallococcus coralloides DSM 2259]